MTYWHAATTQDVRAIFLQFSSIHLERANKRRKRRKNWIFQGSTFRVRRSRKTLWKLLWLFTQLEGSIWVDCVHFAGYTMSWKKLNPLDIFLLSWIIRSENLFFLLSWLKSFDNNRFEIYIQQIGNWISWDSEKIKMLSEKYFAICARFSIYLKSTNQQFCRLKLEFSIFLTKEIPQIQLFSLQHFPLDIFSKFLFYSDSNSFAWYSK